MPKSNPPKERVSSGAEALLPAPVSSIQVQKKNKTRFSVFVQDEFLIGISDATLTHLNIRKGLQINRKLLQQMVEAENEWELRDYFIRLLSRRDHSRKELETKARKKGYPDHAMSGILDELEEKKYLNNRSFAIKYARDKFEFNRWGTHKIRMELKKKGINEADIQNALAEIPRDDAMTAIRELITKNSRKFKRAEPDKRRKKIFDFLVRKGFDSEHIFSLLPELLKQLEE